MRNNTSCKHQVGPWRCQISWQQPGTRERPLGPQTSGNLQIKRGHNTEHNEVNKHKLSLHRPQAAFRHRPGQSGPTKAALRRWAPLTRGPQHFPQLRVPIQQKTGAQGDVSADAAHTCQTPPAAAHLTTACGPPVHYLSHLCTQALWGRSYLGKEGASCLRDMQAAIRRGQRSGGGGKKMQVIKVFEACYKII